MNSGNPAEAKPYTKTKSIQKLTGCTLRETKIVSIGYEAFITMSDAPAFVICSRVVIVH